MGGLVGMDEIYELYRYLPMFTKEEQNYMSFLQKEIEKNVKSEAFQSAYLTAHMIFMFYVYCCIWKIKKIYTERYNYGIIGFPKYRDANNDDIDLRKLDSLFDLSLVAEKTVFDVFQLIEMDRAEISQLKKSVDRRNNIAHSTGQISFSSQKEFAEGMLKIVKHCERIHCILEKNLIRPAYESFLVSNRNQDDWEYGDMDEQVNQSLLYNHKLSEIELKSCAAFGVSKFSDRLKYNFSADEVQTIRQLHTKTKEIYSKYSAEAETA